MAEATAASKKEKTVVTEVNMEDGRTAQFAGKRKLNKDYLIDPSKISVDGDAVMIQAGAIALRTDFVNGSTRTFQLPLSLIAQFAGHGASQKYGDELATTADKPLSPEDMVSALEDLDAQIQQGKWGAERASGGAVSGASIVIQAIMEASGKPVDVVKGFIQKLLDRADAEGNKPSRKQVYDSFRKADTKTGKIIARLEQEKLAKETKLDSDAELSVLANS